MTILHVIPNTHPNGITRELRLLLAANPQATRETAVCCLGSAGPSNHLSRLAGAAVTYLNWRRRFDPKPLWQLAALLRDTAPDVVCAWGLPALRSVRMAATATSAAIVVRKPIPSARPWLSPLDRWLFRRVNKILVAGDHEAARCKAAGLPAEKVDVLRPGVDLLPTAQPSSKPHILCVGPMLPHKGVHDAVWAFDFLQLADQDVELTITGEGPERGRVEHFARRMGQMHRVHLPGEVTGIEQLLADAAVVWVPTMTDSGAGVVLEAMAAGLPVVASRWPGLAEIIVDGETGILVDPGNKLELARATRRLLDDPALRRRLGEAGRERAARVFPAAAFVQSWARAVATASARAAA